MAGALEGLESAGTKPDSAVLDELSRTLGTRAREAHEPRRAPRPQEPAANANCRVVCGSCASVCPNRANAVIRVNGRKQMLHIDGLCNECGNCASFCAEKSAPYLEKLTVFCGEKELSESRNSGFAPLPDGRFLLRWDGEVRRVLPEDRDLVPEIGEVIAAVRDHYPWLLYK